MCPLKAFISKGGRRTLRRLASIRGLDRRPGLYPGYLSEAHGVDPRRYPALSSAAPLEELPSSFIGKPLSMHAIGEDLYVFSNYNDSLYLTRMRGDDFYHMILPSKDFSARRSLVQFNLYSNPSDPLSGEYRHLCLIFPDHLCFDLDETEPLPTPLEAESMPNLRHVCVHTSRLFGTDRDRLYVSAYNDPTNWDLDTVTDSGAANAWATTVQSNTLSDGDFTALCVYEGRVMAFKSHFCHVVNGTQNPFRVSDLLTVGTDSAATIAEVGGQLFFADKHHVYRYDGDTVKSISDKLALSDLTGAMAAGCGDLYYLFVPSVNRMFVYSQRAECWGELGDLTRRPLFAMAATDAGVYLLDEEANFYQTERGKNGGFLFRFSPTAETGDTALRLARLHITLTAESGATLSASYTDTSGRTTALLSYTGEGSAHTRHIVSRTMTPSDRGGYITLEGRGAVTVHEISVTALESNS